MGATGTTGSGLRKAALTLLLAGLPLFAQPLDTIICGGRVFDGDDWLPPGTCVGIRAGRIANLGPPSEARRRIDAPASIVAPGFIDVHTHVERNIPPDRPFRAPNFVRMGATTLISGNCGISVPEIAPFLKRLEANRTQVNLATFIGHNTLRLAVMPGSARPARPTEIARMAEMVERAVRDGALGFSTGLSYSPGCFAGADEIRQLTEASSRNGGMYATHMRDEGASGAAALEEALENGRLAHSAVHLSHLKIASAAHWGEAAQRLARIDQARLAGLRVTLDAYGYAASSTGLDQLLPRELRGARRSISAAFQDHSRRDALVGRLLANLKGEGFEDYAFARVALCESDHALDGLTIPALARRLELDSASPAAQAQAVLWLAGRGGAQMLFFCMHENDVEAILAHPLCSIGSDSTVRYSGMRALHPRGVGVFPRVLTYYVRDRKTFPLETALRKMTSLPADTFDLRERGRLRPGYWADLTIFDPQDLRENATYENGLTPPSGIRFVLVNGVPVVASGAMTGALPGRAIRRTRPIPSTIDIDTRYR